MPVLKSFSAPAKLRDELTPATRRAWSAKVGGMFDDFKAPRYRQFYDPTAADTPSDADVVPVLWPAFPARLRGAGSEEAIAREADRSREQQDEYCEWSVEREQGKITRITFTTEIPEYFELLAAHDQARLLAIYRQLAGPGVKIEHLLTGKQYRPKNRWNRGEEATGGLVHLTQANNTLGAAVVLAAEATILRERDGQPIGTKQELAGCAGLGHPRRNSDPQIAAIVNGAASTGASLTLQDPLGLYIHRLVTDGMSTPDGTDPQTFWKLERGSPGRAVRASFSVPKAKGYTVSEVKIAGRPIRFGAQLADRVRVRLTAIVKPGNARPRRHPCI